MPTYTHRDNTPTHISSVLITMETKILKQCNTIYTYLMTKNTESWLNQVVSLKTQTHCFKPAVNIKYTKLEKNV